MTPDERNAVIEECLAVIEAKRVHWQGLADRSDEDSMIGHRYRDYTHSHEADLDAIRSLLADAPELEAKCEHDWRIGTREWCQRCGLGRTFGSVPEATALPRLRLQGAAFGEPARMVLDPDGEYTFHRATGATGND